MLEVRVITLNDRERVNTLCTRIQVEYDREMFIRLCEELSKLLDGDRQKQDCSQTRTEAN